MLRILFLFLALLSPFAARDLPAQTVLFEDVRMFDGVDPDLKRAHVLVVDGLIEKISTSPLTVPEGARVIDAGQRVLTPGFIDLHSHLTGHVPPELEGSHPVVQGAFAAKVARYYLDHGFTSVRDAGGAPPALARALASGEIEGPRLFPSGAVVTQTAGHGDWRSIHEPHPYLQSGSPYVGGGQAVIADGVDQTLAAVRENLKNGATQIKIMGGGGVMSDFDPIHTLQPSPAEIRAAVQAAADWDTYVLAHAYTSEAVTRLVENGVRCIEHGLLIDDETARLVKDNDVVISTQLVIFQSLGEMPGLTDNNREKAALVLEGQENLIRLIKKYGITTGFGTDLIQSAYTRLPQEFTARAEYWTAAEVLRQATSESAKVIRMAGKLNRYQPFGEIREGWLADLVLFEQNPLEDISVLERPERAIALVMQNGLVVTDNR
ncbi:MAG: amidohydrolase family protein [Pseudomonadota bacterium]